MDHCREKTFSNSLPGFSFPFFFSLLWTLTISRAGQGVSVSLLSNWFILGKFGFMGRSVWAGEVAPTGWRKWPVAVAILWIQYKKQRALLIPSIFPSISKWMPAFLWVTSDFRKGIWEQMRGRSRNLFKWGKKNNSLKKFQRKVWCLMFAPCSRSWFSQELKSLTARSVLQKGTFLGKNNGQK